MIMVHSDNKGLVLPPRVAPTQVMIVPIFFKDNNKAEVKAKAAQLRDKLCDAGIRCESDERERSPGWKFNDWEMKGVPIRLELGPKDIKSEQVLLVRRDTGDKKRIPWTSLVIAVQYEMHSMQTEMLSRARSVLESRTSTVKSWDSFMSALEVKNIALIPWCGGSKCEESIKKRSGERVVERKEKTEEDDEPDQLTGAAKSLCIPFQQPPMPAETCCIGCETPAYQWCLFGKSY